MITCGGTAIAGASTAAAATAAVVDEYYHILMKAFSTLVYDSSRLLGLSWTSLPLIKTSN